MATKQLKIQFCEFIPTEIEEGTLYISMEFATASHKCACGCGQEVVTPFTPTDWKLTYDGESVSLSPSIGNWSYQCRSHYFIKNSKIVWAGNMSQKAIDAGRFHDQLNKNRHYKQHDTSMEETQNKDGRQDKPNEKRAGIFKSIARFFGF
ncbi:DUF6527 family protein [Desulfovibrio sp. JC010]|uniref:DUF6527 family protein n=1 Tax=Desulfovibrio sp. JC010 TaxID=2593641 RepID=UPI0013D806BB|nr:DUF6527 family protein [Desulfovibrio sp. JC010]NDV25969.1 hypothetical protein [Desulfovibrio sp. JC010]